MKTNLYIKVTGVYSINRRTIGFNIEEILSIRVVNFPIVSMKKSEAQRY